MDFSYLKKYEPKLIAEMNNRGYAVTYINRHRTVIAQIVSNAPENSWQSYADIFDWYNKMYQSPTYLHEILMCDHIDLEEGVINVEYTKGRAQHYVALHPSTVIMLKSYDSAISRFYPERKYFFPRDQEKPLYQVWIPETFREIWDSVNESHSAVAYDLRHNYATENINKWLVTLHAHQFRHAKASHWLEDGLNIVQISYLLGHAQLETTTVYLDVTLEQKNAALATLEDENDKKVQAKWKQQGNTLSNFCGIKAIK